MTTEGKHKKTTGEYAKEYACKQWAAFCKKIQYAVDWTNHYANLITALATIAISILTFFTIKIYHRQIRDSQAVQRAFVHIAPQYRIDRVIGPTGQVEELHIVMTWENSGNTPTKNFIKHENFQPIEGTIPDNFPYTDHWNTGIRSHTRSVLAPKQSRWSVPLTVKAKTMHKVTDND